MLVFDGISKRFSHQSQFALKNINFTLKSGQVLVLVGSSGCGKTTCLRLINRLIKPTQGKITLNNQNISDIDPVKLRRKIGYAFQRVGLFPHLTLAENIAIVLRLEGIKSDERNDSARELLDFVNLPPDEFANRFPHELSGGQQQRVGVARALANEPELLLMDEPFGALDAITRDSLQQDFRKLQQKIHKTVVFVTHDVFEAIRLADLIGGDG